MNRLVFIAIALTAVIAVSATESVPQPPPGQRVGTIECWSHTSCEPCANVQQIHGTRVNPCYWDWEANSCMSSPNDDVPRCNAQKTNFNQECRDCKKKWQDKKAAKARAAQAAQQPQAESRSTPAAGGQAQGQDQQQQQLQQSKGAGAGAGATPSKRVQCNISGSRGLCVPNGKCTGGRPSAQSTCASGSTCCGIVVRTSKAEKEDKCGKFSSLGKCWDCIRAGCVMHKTTGKCAKLGSAWAKTGDANLVQDDSFCYKLKGERDARNAKKKANKKK